MTDTANGSSRAIELLITADDRYAMPLAVAATSAARWIDTVDRDLVIHVFDVGMTADSRKKVDDSVARHGASVRWVSGIEEHVRGLPEAYWFSLAVHARMLAPELLPDVSRVLYLDSDLVVLRDTTELFDIDLDGRIAAAVPDVGCPFVSSPYGVPYWFERNRDARDLNFNTGVMVMDLDAWRAERVTDRTFELLREPPGRGVMLNQSSLNTVVGDRFKAVDPRWNHQSALCVPEPDYAAQLPYPQAEVERLKRDPWIVHFTDERKPWHGGLEHPFVDRWFAALDETAWAGWRPSPPSMGLLERARGRAAALARRAAGRGAT